MARNNNISFQFGEASNLVSAYLWNERIKTINRVDGVDYSCFFRQDESERFGEVLSPRAVVVDYRDNIHSQIDEEALFSQSKETSSVFWGGRVETIQRSQPM